MFELVAAIVLAVMAVNNLLELRRSERFKNFVNARFVFLEQREVELTRDVANLTKKLDKMVITSAEVDRVLPPLRAALEEFQKFNKTY